MKYYVDYLDEHGDLCHVWVNASDEYDAEMQVKNEYWDVDSIISVRKAK